VRPLALITSCTQKKGFEFRDASVSLSLDYAEALAAAGALPLVVPNAPLVPASVADRMDGLVLTGGGDVDPALFKDRPGAVDALALGIDRPRDDLETALIRAAVTDDTPILAICRGMQILNVALGGTLYIDLPTEVGGEVPHRSSDRSRDGVHAVEIEEDTLLRRIAGAGSLAVNSTHHQAVRDLGEGLRVSARAEDGVIEGVELRDHPFCVGIQFHPERLEAGGEPVLASIFEAFTAACRKREPIDRRSVEVRP